MTDTPQAAAPLTAAGQKAMEAVMKALNAQNLPQAMDLASEAVEAGHGHPLAYNLAAHKLELAHRYPEAIVMLERGLALSPNDLELLTALGLCLNRAGRAKSAVAAFDTVLLAMPDNAIAHHGKGSSLEQIGDAEAAERHYQAAVDLAPDYAEALSSLAALLARTGQVERARVLAQKSLELNPESPLAQVALAFGELSGGDYPQAEKTLKGLLRSDSLSPDERAAAQMALGDALDGQARFDDAYSAYATGNALLQKIRDANTPPVNAESHFDLTQRLTAWFGKLKPGAWRPNTEAADSPAAHHVFVVSAVPRSGADILEAALAGHPDAIVLEGQDTLVAAEAEFVLAPDGPDRLATLSREAAKRLRAAYWSQLTDIGVEPAGKVIVDRAAFGPASLGLIAALFPQAKILFSLRDPRDIVLTSFRRPYLINPALSRFTTLDGATKLYDAALALMQVSQEKLPITVTNVRYENLAANLKDEMAAVCALLGLAWDDEMQASASMVPAPRVVSSWRSYAAYLAPFLPTLRPWLDRFGYPES